MLDLEFGHVALIDDLVLDGLFETTGALLHVDALLEEQGGLLEVGADMLDERRSTSPSWSIFCSSNPPLILNRFSL